MDNDILKRISELENRVSELEGKGVAKITSNTEDRTKAVSVKEFMLTKKATGDVQKTLLIAYYLEEVTKLPSFNIEDIERTYRSAKEQIPSNLNDKINKNIGKGFLMEAAEKKDSKKAWELTSTGIKFVEDEMK